MIKRITLSILISALIGNGVAQTVKVDTTSQHKKLKFLPTGLRIGVDAMSFARERFSDTFTGWEVSGDMDIYRYLLSFDYGKSGRDFGVDTVNYKNNGRFWRAGIDANFLTRDPDRNAFFIGMRYGQARYSEYMSVNRYDSVWGEVNRSYSNENLRAHWMELTTGIKVKIWQFLWMGYTAHFRFGLNQDESRQMLSFDIPGYGRTNKDTSWGFNYHIFFRIPFRKSTPILPAAKKK